MNYVEPVIVSIILIGLCYFLDSNSITPPLAILIVVACFIYQKMLELKYK